MSCVTILIPLLTNHQSSHKAISQPGDLVWSLLSSSGFVWVCMYGLTYSLYHPWAYTKPMLQMEISFHPLIITLAGTLAIIKVSGHQHRWLAGGYDLEIRHS